MRIIFSRKGFDTGSGGHPSPIINNVPVSLPIPGLRGEPYAYKDIVHPTEGPIGPHVEAITKSRIQQRNRAHYDPQIPWEYGHASLGQQGASQSHLENQKVGIGDVFVFFGLFKDYGAPKGHQNAKPHHRIFGMMTIDNLHTIGSSPGKKAWSTIGLPRPHPHTERNNMEPNNSIWTGEGLLARNSRQELRLSTFGRSPSFWNAPDWLVDHGMSYHADPKRWGAVTVKIAARGQEFVSNVGHDRRALAWVKALKSRLEMPAT